jgi:hypothetical protein
MCQSSVWSQPDHTPFHQEYSKCPLIGQSGFTGLSQQIQKISMHDSKMYQCVNRGDENPFSKKSSDEGTDDWLKLVTKPCSKSRHRRCLGHTPHQCIYVNGKKVLHTDYSSTLLKSIQS